MGLFIVIATIAACTVGAGLVIKWWTDRTKFDLQITWPEFAIGAVVITLAVAPLSTWVGYQQAKKSRAVFEQFINGRETNVSKRVTQCHRDGSCYWEYSCDPYIVMVTYTYPCGKTTCTGVRPETRYHQCPYVTQEFHYDVNTSLGDYNFGRHRFPYDPDSHRWRSYVSVPASTARAAGVGDPPSWLEVKYRLERGFPGPVTKIVSYDNFVLASDATTLRQWSASARKLDSLKLLPPLTREIIGFYDADKVSAKAVNISGWSRRLAYLNSVAGPQLSADVRVAVVRTQPLYSHDAYANALFAHWADEEKWKRFAMPKNALVFVIGTDDGKTVSWARAVTGMPIGNEAIVAVTRTAFTGKPIDVDSIIGQTHWEGSIGAQPRAVHGQGVLERIVFGLDNKETKFQRIEMSSFMYLKGEIKPTRGGWIATIVITTMLCLVVWVVFLFAGAPRLRQWHSHHSWR